VVLMERDQLFGGQVSLLQVEVIASVSGSRSWRRTSKDCGGDGGPGSYL
jgi:hypothetical protein